MRSALSARNRQNSQNLVRLVSSGKSKYNNSMEFIDNLFSSTTRLVKKYRKDAEKINALEPQISKLSDEELRAKISSWKEELKGKEWEDQSEILNRISHEVFAVTREASKRTIGQRHFDVQLIGGMVLHHGRIAEMKTGEGKTLTATLPMVLNALAGRGAHLVTVNDYLARWHASLMGPIYSFLGLSVASIQHEKSFIYDANFEPEQEEIDRMESETQGLVMDVKHMRPVTRAEAYRADITYGTNNEYGFDYLRDNMVGDLSQLRQRELHFVIVDEVDSILIDEARTPLIISAPDTDPTDKYYQFAKLADKLNPERDYIVDEKRKVTTLTEEGIERLEKLLGVKNIYEESGMETVHHIEQSIRSKENYLRDRDYVVQNGEVIIVDEFTGRLMFGRRYSDGLHQAIEAKENVKIQQESKTLATITFQNYFRMYRKLAGMTGTALTESEEFFKIYHLEVVPIPTHRPMIRIDRSDSVYKSEHGKFEAIVKEVKERHAKGQPMLIGTVSIQKNELMAEYLKKAGLPFELLNAKNHEHEANVIAQAGRYGAITVATNIAGRGVDILLGGNPIDQEEAEKVRAAGGLYVLGTERHESRRIDNQLRGRSGRQGDPGFSQFYVSVEDDLMRLFGGDKLKALMNRLGIPEDQPIEAGLVSSSIEQAQKKIEGLNFDTRKNVLEYDDIMNRQRHVIYKRRRTWLEDVKVLQEDVLKYVHDEVADIIKSFREEESADDAKLLEKINALYPTTLEENAELKRIANSGNSSEFALVDYATGLADKRYAEKEQIINQQFVSVTGENPDSEKSVMRQLERAVALQNLDLVWMQHLDTMSNLRDSVGLRGYGQRDPLVEYKRDGYELFKRAEAQIEKGTAYGVFHAGLQVQPQQAVSTPITQAAAEANRADEAITASGGEDIGRNDPCPCGSGKKFKKCGMLNTVEHQANMAKR